MQFLGICGGIILPGKRRAAMPAVTFREKNEKLGIVSAIVPAYGKPDLS